MRCKTEGQLQRAIRRGRFPRESLVVDRNKFRYYFVLFCQVLFCLLKPITRFLVTELTGMV